ncbi:hypothetical protein M430DRAFT_19818 [Amorphotheca resinae ATCC 22711]|uniref:Uncharacterized protein n=1 Tax=Amorphotheca resinae ATCC 22711 TaxID=857342 RepID=A0A2T3B0C5_AMORE|nr:hypothetical protein M430DRAFT_19818 [Amorphotheca resinae ATCC 22711]PSS16851.1 hypothetical protein M430DRAFT_19818 [Amorphotheca resinae ATCC 22711]
MSGDALCRNFPEQSTFKILKGCRRRTSLPLNVRRDSNLDARDPPAARPRHNQRHDDVPASALITRFQSRMHRIISDRHPTFVPLYTSTPRYQSVPWKASCYMDSRSRETQEAPFPYPIGPHLHTTQLMWLSKKRKSSPPLQSLISGWRCLSRQTVATARVGTTDPTLHGQKDKDPALSPLADSRR